MGERYEQINDRMQQMGERVAGSEEGYKHLATKADLREARGEIKQDIAALNVKVNLILGFMGAAMTALIGVGIRELFFG